MLGLCSRNLGLFEIFGVVEREFQILLKFRFFGDKVNYWSVY